jgi:hypothetical protein
MATRWAQAAALVDHQHTLIKQFNGLAVGAKRQLSTARQAKPSQAKPSQAKPSQAKPSQAKDGGGPIKAADGSELTVDRSELAKKWTAIGEPSGSQVSAGS